MALRAAVVERRCSFFHELAVDELDPSVVGNRQSVLDGVRAVLRRAHDHSETLASITWFEIFSGLNQTLGERGE